MAMAKVILRRTVKILGLLFALLVLFILEENIRGRIELNAYKKELRAKGEKLTLEELGIPKVPKEGNGTEALLKAADELAALGKTCRLASDGQSSKMKMISPGRARSLLKQTELPSPSHPDGQPPAPHGWDDLGAELAGARPLLEQLKNALNQPVLGIEIDYEKGFETPLPHLVNLRHLARWLASAAINDLHHGNSADAVKNIQTIASLTRFQKDERLLISQLVRMAVGSIGLNVTWEALQSPEWNDAQLEQLQRIWQLNNFAADMEQCFETERVMGEIEYTMLRGSAKKRWKAMEGIKLLESFELTNETQWGLDSDFIKHIRSFLWWIAWSRHDELHNLQDWQNLIEGARLAALEKSWSNAKSFLNVEKEIGKNGLYDQCRFMFSLNRSPLSRAVFSAIRCKIQRELTVTAIALKRYQLRHGKLPGSLSLLVPEFLPDLPRDYMNGKPLRYRLLRPSQGDSALNKNGSFTLYSVGENGRDDGGDPNPPPEKKNSKNMWDGLDFVWPMPSTQKEVEAAEAAAKK